MEKLFSKLAEAAQIRAAMAKQEVEFWNKIAEATQLVEFSPSKETVGEPANVYTQDQKPKGAFLTTEEAAEYLNISKKTLEAWRVTGGGPKFSKIGSRVRYKIEELNAYADGNTFPHTSAYGAEKLPR